ncbi:MAG: hypothetical protein ACK5MZ_10470 [Aestuariibaculum sp.]
MLGKLQHIIYAFKADTPLIRCLFGVSLSLLLATSLNIMAPHLTAIFTLMLLGKERQNIGLKKSVALLFIFLILGTGGRFLGKYLVDYPLVILLVLGVVVFWTFRLTQIPNPIRLLFLIFTILLSFASIQANILGGVALSLLLTELAIALFVVQLSFLLFPSNQISTVKQNQSVKADAKINLDKLALNGLLVVLPVIIVFFTFNINVLPLTLVFIVLLSFDPFVYQSKKGLALFVGNFFGGLMGILAYNILVIAPSFLLYAFLIIGISGYFTLHTFSNKKTAPIFELAFKTFFVVMGTISVTENSAGATIAERLFQIGLAIIYVIVAYKVINTFNNPVHETN